MDEHVHVTARFQAKPDRIEQLIDVLAELAIPSREEPGCLDYGFYQDSADKATILAIETWKNSAAIESHLTTQHFSEAFAKLGELLQGEPIINKCKRII